MAVSGSVCHPLNLEAGAGRHAAAGPAARQKRFLSQGIPDPKLLLLPTARAAAAGASAVDPGSCHCSSGGSSMLGGSVPFPRGVLLPSDSSGCAGHVPSQQEGGMPPVCVLRCRRRFTFCRNRFPHSAQACGRSPAWPCRPGAWPGSLWGLSAACTRWWTRRESLLLKRLGHSRHVKGCLPVWVFWWWVTRFPFWLKRRPQTPQVKGRSPVWMRWWVTKLVFRLNLFPQTSQR
uniref:Uncharacterized protein n=1 Tax=Aquila chrysaetos chrysaetos TaxID=223781 RepID=A0A663FEP2_AQUCH